MGGEERGRGRGCRGRKPSGSVPPLLLGSLTTRLWSVDDNFLSEHGGGRSCLAFGCEGSVAGFLSAGERIRGDLSFAVAAVWFRGPIPVKGGIFSWPAN